ncbi:WbqC family protein [Limnobacter sp.]
MSKVAILQSNYIPWKGYFDIISAADEFIIYDDMQFTKRDWRNRNLIKTPQGAKWITVPVKVKGKFDQSIKNTEIDGCDWKEQHWKAISLNYKKSKFFKELSHQLEELYSVDYQYISELNRTFISFICNYLEINTKISNSWDYSLSDGKTERLVDLCRQAGATEYISGPAAKDYIEPNCFSDAGIQLTWFDYSGYPEYPQLWGEFVHGVTILDLLFNCGKDSKKYMRFVK